MEVYDLCGLRSFSDRSVQKLESINLIPFFVPERFQWFPDSQSFLYRNKMLQCIMPQNKPACNTVKKNYQIIDRSKKKKKICYDIKLTEGNADYN